MQRVLAVLALTLIALAFFALPFLAFAQEPAAALRYRADLTREAQFIFGLDAPVPMLAAQIEQESGWRPGITAWDNGRGLAQFMDPTAQWVAEKFDDLGQPEPYNPRWAMRALVRLDQYNAQRTAGDTACDTWGAGLKAYNAGLGFVQRARKRSTAHGQWFGRTELINTGQSAKNCEYSRLYPRWILLGRQHKYLRWGRGVACPDVISERTAS